MSGPDLPEDKSPSVQQIAFRVENLETALRALADSQARTVEDMHQLNLGITRLIEDRKALGRAFSQIEELTKELQLLKAALEQERLDRMQRVIDKQREELEAVREAKKAAIREILKITLIIAASVIASRYGFKILG